MSNYTYKIDQMTGQVAHKLRQCELDLEDVNFYLNLLVTPEVETCMLMLDKPTVEVEGMFARLKARKLHLEDEIKLMKYQLDTHKALKALHNLRSEG